MDLTSVAVAYDEEEDKFSDRRRGAHYSLSPNMVVPYMVMSLRTVQQSSLHMSSSSLLAERSFISLLSEIRSGISSHANLIVVG